MLNTIRKIVDKLDKEQEFYSFGFVSLILYPLNSFLPYPWYWFVFAFFSIGFFIWGTGIIELINSKVLGKYFLGLIVLAGGTFNIALASTIVNTTLQVPAYPFGYTVTLVSILAIPFTLSIFMLVGFAILFVIAMLSSTKQATQKIYAMELSLLGRMIAIIIILALLTGSFLQKNKWYTEPLGQFTQWFAFSFEMEQFTYCKVAKGEKVLYLRGNKIVMGKRTTDSYLFIVSECRS